MQPRAQHGARARAAGDLIAVDGDVSAARGPGNQIGNVAGALGDVEVAQGGGDDGHGGGLPAAVVGVARVAGSAGQHDDHGDLVHGVEHGAVADGRRDVRRFDGRGGPDNPLRVEDDQPMLNGVGQALEIRPVGQAGGAARLRVGGHGAHVLAGDQGDEAARRAAVVAAHRVEVGETVGVGGLKGDAAAPPLGGVAGHVDAMVEPGGGQRGDDVVLGVAVGGGGGHGPGIAGVLGAQPQHEHVAPRAGDQRGVQQGGGHVEGRGTRVGDVEDSVTVVADVQRAVAAQEHEPFYNQLAGRVGVGAQAARGGEVDVVGVEGRSTVLLGQPPQGAVDVFGGHARQCCARASRTGGDGGSGAGRAEGQQRTPR